LESSPEETARVAPLEKTEVLSAPFIPAGAGLLGDILPVDVGGMERGLQHFLEELAGTSPWAVVGLSEGRPVYWLLAGLAGIAVAVEVARRRLREPAVELRSGSTEDSTWTWSSI
jgi:hypothetical protein